MNKKALIAEFIATFAFTFIGVGAIAANYISGGASGLVGIALAHGLTIAVMVAAIGAYSGAHINPAVTIGLWSTKNIDNKNALGYIAAQLLGAVVAAALIKMAMPLDVLKAVGMGTPAIGEGISLGMAFVTEVILTFLLVFVIYGVAVDKRGMAPAGLWIGVTVTLGILMGGPVSGAAMNPARYFGPALLGGGLQHCWLYFLAPVTGGILGATVYKNYLSGK